MIELGVLIFGKSFFVSFKQRVSQQLKAKFVFETVQKPDYRE